MEKTELRCKMCNSTFEVTKDNVKEEYIQCPMCGEISINPLR